MKKNDRNNFNAVFSRIATKVTKAAGSPIVVALAFMVVFIWAVAGPFFQFSENWQLVINTGTTIITFIMVFIIQHSQNKDTAAIQLKLDELISSSKLASNRLVNSEELSDSELETLRKFYKHISKVAEKDGDVHSSHSVDENNQNGTG